MQTNDYRMLREVQQCQREHKRICTDTERPTALSYTLAICTETVERDVICDCTEASIGLNDS